MDAAFLHDLGTSLGESGSGADASRALALAAESFERIDKKVEALKSFCQAFNFDTTNEAAEQNMKRLAIATGNEWEAAASLLQSTAQNSTGKARTSEAVGMMLLQLQRTAEVLEAKVMKKLEKTTEALEAKIAATAEAVTKESRKKVVDLNANMESGFAEFRTSITTINTQVEKLQDPDFGSAELASMSGKIAQIEVNLTSIGGQVRAMQDHETGVLELAGFQDKRLNTKFFRCSLTRVNGHVSFWTANEDAFIYKCPSTKGWNVSAAPEDTVSRILGGASLGHAYKQDSDFTSPGGWMEAASAGDFEPSAGHVTITCKFDKFAGVRR